MQSRIFSSENLFVKCTLILVSPRKFLASSCGLNILVSVDIIKHSSKLLWIYEYYNEVPCMNIQLSFIEFNSSAKRASGEISRNKNISSQICVFYLMPILKLLCGDGL